MKSSRDRARTVPATGVWEGFGEWSRALAVPVTGSAGAVAGMVIGYVIGTILLNEQVIQPGSSVHMASAVVGALGGSLGWLIGAVAGMVAYRHQPPASQEEAKGSRSSLSLSLSPERCSPCSWSRSRTRSRIRGCSTCTG